MTLHLSGTISDNQTILGQYDIFIVMYRCCVCAMLHYCYANAMEFKATVCVKIKFTWHSCNLRNPKTAQLYKKCAAPKKATVKKDVKSKVAAKK